MSDADEAAVDDAIEKPKRPKKKAAVDHTVRTITVAEWIAERRKAMRK